MSFIDPDLWHQRAPREITAGGRAALSTSDGSEINVVNAGPLSGHTVWKTFGEQEKKKKKGTHVWVPPVGVPLERRCPTMNNNNNNIHVFYWWAHFYFAERAPWTVMWRHAIIKSPSLWQSFTERYHTSSMSFVWSWSPGFSDIIRPVLTKLENIWRGPILIYIYIFYF